MTTANDVHPDAFTAIEVENIDGERVLTDAWPTCSPHFMVTRDIVDPRYFTITHLRSCAEVLGPFATVRMAQLYAGVFAGLPMAWGSFGAKTIGINQQAREKARFLAAWEEMPLEIRRWRLEVAADLRQGKEAGM